ncbi:MAG TPA: thiamine phosphate synthase, partial [Pyrinomonadaceae bacterium]|nr:thiamine phosphate synthase [Pyrinomonadaceae bacterium]
LAFGPIFPTSTKENPDPVTGLGGLAAVATIKGPLPLVAIGGITLERAPTVFKAGADSVAVIADLVADPTTIAENMSEMISLTHAVPNASSRS